MPGYKGHLAGAAVFYGVALYLLRSTNPTLMTMTEWAFFLFIGALFPDIDIKSKGQKLFYWIVLAALIILLIQQRIQLLILLSFMMIVPMLVRHRGLFHRWWFITGLTVATAVCFSFCMPTCTQCICFDALFFLIGAMSHLWFDMGLKRMMRW